MHIVAKKIRGIAYYYAQSSFREKLDAQATGKGKGSGKSRVRTESIYLGTAEAIVTALKEARAPVEVRHREFGFVAAVYQIAVELGVPEALRGRSAWVRATPSPGSGRHLRRGPGGTGDKVVQGAVVPMMRGEGRPGNIAHPAQLPQTSH